jgi:uncharacterized protein (DUF2235 family)
MAKNIVILSDGTCNDTAKADLSNVLKLYRILVKDENQLVFYDPGMGTFGNESPWQRRKQKWKYGFFSLTGVGLDGCVLKAYRFLIEHYKNGDQIYLFGYSRGAYTVRVLAGLLYLIGILRPEQKNLCEHALGAYKHINKNSITTDEDLFSHARRFQRITSSKRIPIKFIGVWDTVSSILVPHEKKRGKIVEQRLPYTAKNPSVEIFRQAMAIDERRHMFRLNQWKEPQKFNLNEFISSDDKDQDIKQVWFCGSHGDVGGGYPEAESGLSKFSLNWMVHEAKTAGLKINTRLYNHMVLGQPDGSSEHTYVAPDATAPLHDSMDIAMLLIGLLFKKTKIQKGDTGIFSYQLIAEPRPISNNALIHKSVFERMNKDKEYKPINLPKKHIDVE